MAKKRSEVSGNYHKHMATGLSPEERTKQNKKANAERAFGGDGNEKNRDVELSETTGQAPQARFKSRGVPNPPAKRLPTHNWN